MLLTIRTTYHPATDIGFLFHKNPGHVQSFELSFGQAHVFYPEATEQACTVCLLLDIDPVGLVRGKNGNSGRTLEQYVNDRPYVASSFLSTAIAEVFGTAMGGKCKQRPDLLEVSMPLEVGIEVLPVVGGEDLLSRLFAPLGYELEARRHALDLQFPEWGESPYYSVRLRHNLRLSELLTHLYVLIPTLDANKHYYIGDAEVDKLLSKGEKWLAEHPERDMIVRRYLKRKPSLIREALTQLIPEEATEDSGESLVESSGLDAGSLEGGSLAVASGSETTENAVGEKRESRDRGFGLHAQRLGAVVAVLKHSGATRVLDLGCGEGKLVELLLKDFQFVQILGMDVSYRTLEVAERRLHVDRMPPMQRQRVNLIHGSLIYRDKRLEGFDAAAVVEVIEHLEPHRLVAFAASLFGHARPKTAVITTPNREYNAKFETLEAGRFRHGDHRFEWSRSEFQDWCLLVGTRYGYAVRFMAIGEEDAELGGPSQMAIFERQESVREVSA